MAAAGESPRYGASGRKDVAALLADAASGEIVPGAVGMPGNVAARPVPVKHAVTLPGFGIDGVSGIRARTAEARSVAARQQRPGLIGVGRGGKGHNGTQRQNGGEQKKLEHHILLDCV